VHLSQDREQSAHPWISQIEHSRLLRFFQNSTDECHSKLSIFHLESFNENLLQVKMKASHWLILGNCKSSDEASQTLEVVFDHHCSPLWYIGNLQELLFVDNHTFFED